jgi:two-component system nitrogen regulation response regulator GlnG
LFGHEKGAFTGATERKIGKFEQAKDGTLFLDEIGDMPLELQAKMLRVLQEKEITRTGGSATIQVNTRIVAATNQELKEKVQKKEFREDLYYRLNVVPLDLPPLRDRREDIPALIDYFLTRAGDEYGTTASGLTKEAMDLLCNYEWPGNIRELENIIQRAALLSPDALLNAADFPSLIMGHANSGNSASLEGLINQKLQSSLSQIDLQDMNNLYEMVLHQMERPLINIVLAKTRGNQVKAAEVLGINRNTLRKKIQTLNITAKRS